MKNCCIGFSFNYQIKSFHFIHNNQNKGVDSNFSNSLYSI